MWQGDKKKLVGGLVALLLVGSAAGLWWSKRQSAPRAAQGEAVIAASSGPFEVVSCQSQLYDDQPALAVTFSEPLDRSQSFDNVLSVVDNGPVSGNDKAPASAREGSWVVHDNPRILVFPFISPDRKYAIRINPGVVAASGVKLAEAKDCEASSDAMAPSFFFASKGTVLPVKQNGGLPVVTVNVPEVDVQFLRVNPQHLPRFIDKVIGKSRASREEGEGEGEDDEDNGYYWDPRGNRLKGSTYGEQLNQLRDISSSVYSGRFITDEKPNRRKVTYLPVESIAELKEPGLYVAIMTQPGRFEYAYQTTYFYVTDIGLHIRRQAKTMDVFSTSLTSGKALAGVDLEVLDADGRTLQSGKVDGDGHGVLTSVPDKAQLLLARRGKEVSMLVLHEPGLDLSEFDIGGHLPRDAKLFIYAGRDLYRPGEKFQASLIARSADGRALPPTPLRMDVKKPNGDVVSTLTLQPNTQRPGYFQQKIDLPADADTGRWSLELRADPAAKRADTVWSFQVEEFLPERMKLNLKSDTAALQSGDEFKLKVQGDYLYGAPAAGNRVLGSVAVERARNPQPKLWPGFIFGDFADEQKKSRQELEESALDETGAGEINIPFNADGVSSAMRVRATLSLLESGGRPVVRSVERSYWPAAALIGVRPGFERDVTREGSSAEFELARIAPDGTFAPLAEAEFKLFREDRQWYWRYDDQRGWHSGYSTENQVVQAGKVSLKTRGKLLLPVEWGTYRLEVRDPATEQTMRYRFYAGWNAQPAEDLGNRPDRVKIKMEGAPVKPGDSIKLTLTPPHDGEALITVEADKVLWSKRVPVSASGTTVSVPIDKSWTRSDMYVTAVVFRPGSQGDRVTPARAVGLSWIPLARDDRKLAVKLTAPDRAEPEKRATVRVKVDGAEGKQAMLTLSAVDVGILNITSFKTPDAFDFFFGKHRYGAEMSDLYGKLIEKMDGIRGKLKWGGDAGMRDTRSMPKKVKLVDLFSGPITLNAKGEADIPLNLPDFNGTLRLMAVANTAERFGQADREMIVAAPIVAEIATPRFITPGDKAAIALDVSNLSGAPQQVTISLAAEEPVKINGGDKTLSLADKQRSILRFSAETTAPDGLARITLNLRATSAKAGSKAIVIKREFALQVQPPLPREQDNRRLRIEPGKSVKLESAWVERYFRSSATLSVSMSNAPPLNVKSLVKGLLDYPYGCLEQTTSAAYPHVFIDADGAKAVGLAPRSREERARFIEGAIARIASMQGSAGGFNLWGNNGAYEYWLTSYVTGFLMDARDGGFNVPADMTQRAENWMLEKLNASGNYFPNLPASIKPDDKGNYRNSDYELMRNGHQRFAEMAYMGYMLAREQKAPLAVLRQLHDQYREFARSPLPLVHLSLALRLMGDSKRADVALSEAMQRPYGILRSDRNYWGEWLGDYGSTMRDNAMAYALLSRHKVAHPQRENLLISAADTMANRNYHSTQERLALFLAARAAGGDTKTPWSATISSGDGERKLTSLQSASVALSAASLAKGGELTNSGEQVLFVDVESAGFPLKPSAGRGDVLSISRNWYTTSGKPWAGGTLKVGDMLIVRVRANAKLAMPDALIVDHIPAGLEVENLNISQGPQASEFSIEGQNIGAAMDDKRIKHVEYRDDRFVAAVDLRNGQIDVYYMLRVVTPGRFSVPSPFMEDMYRPELRVRGAAVEPIVVVDPRQKEN